MDEDEWAKIGVAVKKRRQALDLTLRQAATGADLSDTTWVKLEAGQVMSSRTLRRAAAPLRWPTDWHRYVIAGEQPPTVEHTTVHVGAAHGDLGGLKATIGGFTSSGDLTVTSEDPTLAALNADPDLSDEDRETVIALVKRLRGR